MRFSGAPPTKRSSVAWDRNYPIKLQRQDEPSCPSVAEATPQATGVFRTLSAAAVATGHGQPCSSQVGQHVLASSAPCGAEHPGSQTAGAAWLPAPGAQAGCIRGRESRPRVCSPQKSAPAAWPATARGLRAATQAPPVSDGRHGNGPGRGRGARPSLSASAVPHLQRHVGSQDAVTSCPQARASGWGSQRLCEGRAAQGKAVRTSSAGPGSGRPLPKATGVFSREASPADGQDVEATDIFTEKWSAAANDRPAGTGVFSRQGSAAFAEAPVALDAFSRQASVTADHQTAAPGFLRREANAAANSHPAATGVFSKEASAADDDDEELHDYQVLLIRVLQQCRVTSIQRDHNKCSGDLSRRGLLVTVVAWLWPEPAC